MPVSQQQAQPGWAQIPCLDGPEKDMVPYLVLPPSPCCLPRGLVLSAQLDTPPHPATPFPQKTSRPSAAGVAKQEHRQGRGPRLETIVMVFGRRDTWNRVPTLRMEKRSTACWGRGVVEWGGEVSLDSPHGGLVTPHLVSLPGDGDTSLLWERVSPKVGVAGLQSILGIQAKVRKMQYEPKLGPF